LGASLSVREIERAEFDVYCDLQTDGLMAGALFAVRAALPGGCKMKPAIPLFRYSGQTPIASVFYFGIVSSGLGQTPPLLDVPKDQFTSFCYFNSGVYSPGAIFCVKAGTSISCRGPDKDGNTAVWVPVSPDNVCPLSTPLPAK
jgi:hypothetical protein